MAIFQDTRRSGSMSFNIAGNSSERDQYAQCLDPHGREVFAPLSARGEFYAVCQSDSSSGNVDMSSDALLYKVRMHGVAPFTPEPFRGRAALALHSRSRMSDLPGAGAQARLREIPPRQLSIFNK